jgi:hypothetical protein
VVKKISKSKTYKAVVAGAVATGAGAVAVKLAKNAIKKGVEVATEVKANAKIATKTVVNKAVGITPVDIKPKSEGNVVTASAA